MQVFTQARYMCGKLDIFITRDNGDILMNGDWVSFREGQNIPSGTCTLSVPLELVGTLADELNAVRQGPPPHETMTAGRLERTDAHLEDMRRIAFAALGKLGVKV